MGSVEGKRAEKSRDIIRLDTHVTYGVSMTHHYTAVEVCYERVYVHRGTVNTTQTRGVRNIPVSSLQITLTSYSGFL